MPDANGLSLWVERDAEFQLRSALKAFERAVGTDGSFTKAEDWWKDLRKHQGNITLQELAVQLREKEKQRDNKENDQILSTFGYHAHRLNAFLPSSIGFQCLQLAELAVQRVEQGTALASYVHRGSKRGEKWMVQDDDGTNWILDVDCAGFVRNVIQSVTGSALLTSLSDRDYMRAKDFYNFVERLEYSVTDWDRTPAAKGEMQWCRVDDLRTVIAGDIIVYRAKGGAAGGSVFTKKDCLVKALKDVKTAELYDIKDEETGDQPVDINVSKLPEVMEWVKEVMEILNGVGIESIEQIRGDNEGADDDDNDDNLQVAISLLEQEGKLSENTVSLLQEVLSSQNGNTGHIMFVAGPAEETSKDAEGPVDTSTKAEHVWRIPVFHSTGVGPKKKRGVKRDYKRFEYSKKHKKWIRGGGNDDVEGNLIEVVVGRICQ